MSYKKKFTTNFTSFLIFIKIEILEQVTKAQITLLLHLHSLDGWFTDELLQNSIVGNIILSYANLPTANMLP